MKRIIVYILSVFTIIGAYGDPNWLMHPNFDGDVDRVVDTPEFVYFTSRTIPKESLVESYYTLARYDKTNDELMMLSTDNVLACNTIANISYNPDKGYLLVIYSNYDIDLLYDDGAVDNIPAYRLASVNQSKKINGITFDPENDRIYLATDFGYVTLNDRKLEISESRMYEEPLTAIARVGSNILAISGSNLLVADASSRRMSLSDYKEIPSLYTPLALAPLSQEHCLMMSDDGDLQYIIMIEDKDGEISLLEITKNNFLNIENNADGVTVTAHTSITQFYRDGTYSKIYQPEYLYEMAGASYDMKEFWHAAQRKGLRSDRLDNGVWTVTHEFMRPNAPAPFIATDIQSHPKGGIMMINFGYTSTFKDNYHHSTPLVISHYNDGQWKNQGPSYTKPEYSLVMDSPNGFAIDPENPNIIYVTSRFGGFIRLNLADPDETIIHLSFPGDVANKYPGFVSFVPSQTGSARGTARFSPPYYDANGDLWMSYADYSNQTPENLKLFYWPAEARRATTSIDNLVLPTLIEVKGYHPTMMEEVVPLKYGSNKNILVYAHKDYTYGNIVVIDTNGTPTDTSDDKVVSFDNFVDTDGNAITAYYVNKIWEDPTTGYVWIGHQNGVFYFNPRDVLSGNKQVTRIKVSRNDGTNLADYLLNEVTVLDIATDGTGRKWFATNGAGLVCTSSDGREILMQVNKSNSGIPEDIIYGLCYEPASNSFMMSTSQGISQYFMPGGSSSAKEDVKAYPNPVRPDYFGYVTIEGLPAGGLVKIADSAGNVIKEMPVPNSSSVQWDVTNHQFKRVAAGVYYILASSAENATAFSAVGKILVVN